MSFKHENRPIYGVQFHPEVTHTPQGRTILNNFIFKICHCRDLWHSGYIIENLITQIRSQVGKQEVILGLSGGVDSSVVAALLYKAIGAQLTCVFVDTGLLRLNEAEEIMQQFADHMNIKVIRVDAQKRFEKALEGIFDPERKRKIIGNLFVKIFEEQASKIKNAKWLAQGTIYPDIIESAGDSSKSAHVIKSHHNVGGLPEDMNLKLLEPLTELFKDEVRHIGYQLGLPYRMVYRHPFPGPGLGVRILGEIKLVYADMLRQADAIYIQELENAGWYDRVSQAFAVFLPVKSVGVVGDQRQYEYVIVLRAVETVDFMTARWAKLPYEFLERVSHRIVNEVSGISRVTYDITGKPPATVEWE
jgi:GMP synthase (glutamine-hydrolysing)